MHIANSLCASCTSFVVIDREKNAFMSRTYEYVVRASGPASSTLRWFTPRCFGPRAESASSGPQLRIAIAACWAKRQAQSTGGNSTYGCREGRPSRQGQPLHQPVHVHWDADGRPDIRRSATAHGHILGDCVCAVPDAWNYAVAGSCRDRHFWLSDTQTTRSPRHPAFAAANIGTAVCVFHSALYVCASVQKYSVLARGGNLPGHSTARNSSTANTCRWKDDRG